MDFSFVSRPLLALPQWPGVTRPCVATGAGVSASQRHMLLTDYLTASHILKACAPKRVHPSVPVGATGREKHAFESYEMMAA